MSDAPQESASPTGRHGDQPPEQHNGLSNGLDKERKHRDKQPHKGSSSRDKDRDRDRDKDRRRDKHRRDDKKSKDRHKDKDKDKEKDKERSRDKHRHDKDKKSSSYSSSSSSKSKHRDKHHSSSKDHSKSGRDKSSSSTYAKVKTEEHSANSIEPLQHSIKAEPAEDCSSPSPSRSQEWRHDSTIKSEDSSDAIFKSPAKREASSDDDIPLSARKKVKKEPKRKRDSSEESFKEVVKKKKNKKPAAPAVTESPSPKKKKVKEEEAAEVWKWWEEEKKDTGTKWKFLEHKGPVFAPDYEPLPSHVKFYYDGKHVSLSSEAEEVAGFYARMIDHDYTTKDIFNGNFFKDWRKVMTDKERSLITSLSKCNFTPMSDFFKEQSEQRKNRTKEEKLELKQKNEDLQNEYGYCIVDGHREKIGNFRIEPPGLFRGRGEHPKMGMLKRRVVPEDVLINCSKDSKVPKPPSGHKWKEVRHDPSVTWLASWTENVQNQVKYVMLNPSSKLKGEKDMQKYETARKLAKCIDKIRKEYREDWKSKEMRIRQRAVALYFIDKLALRAGNEKDEDQADTVGCCSLRVEHIELHEEKDGKEYVVVFDFLGKDSIRYYNEVQVEKRVFKNLQLFRENKSTGDDLFDRLNTAIMNKHLNELMDGLTAKVFRTYNASWTLQQQLDELTNAEDTVAEKILSYNRANRAVAILCNHQRSVPKGHAKSMEKLKEKIDGKRDAVKDMERQVKDARRDAKNGSVKERTVLDKKQKALQRLREQLMKLEVQETDRDENKAIALGTSKLNYLDPRISVAWCKKYDVPIDKIYNKTQRDKFRWAIDMAGPDYRF